jgi:hypothetical protein
MKSKVIFSTLVIFILALSSCKTEQIRPKAMDQYYYTEEGEKYVLRVITKTEPATVGVSGLVVPAVTLNNPTPSTDNGWQLSLQTEKKIIPLLYGLTMINNTGVMVDIVSPYYALFISVPTSLSLENQRSLFKTVPNIERQYFTDNSHYGYGLKYGQCVYKGSDFLEPSKNNVMLFMPDMGSAAGGVYTGGWIFLTPGSYLASVQFLYFEKV